MESVFLPLVGIFPRPSTVFRVTESGLRTQLVFKSTSYILLVYYTRITQVTTENVGKRGRRGGVSKGGERERGRGGKSTDLSAMIDGD